MLNFIGNLLGGVVNTVGDVVKKDQAIKQIKEKGKLSIEQAKIDLSIAKLKAQIKQQETQAANDMTYDMQVLKNRRESLIDEFIILGFFVIMILTFIPATQPTMAEGWRALNNTAWWFEFGIVGILVSTLGLKDVLRIFLGGSIDKLKKKTANKPLVADSKIAVPNPKSNTTQTKPVASQYDVFFDVVDSFKKTKLGNLWINGKKWACISGKYGQGGLPKGLYKLDKCYKLKPVDGKTEPYTGKDLPWVAKLTPQFKTKRTGLLIHPDGNKEGTRGCIGICKQENDIEVYSAITNLLKQKKELILFVNK